MPKTYHYLSIFVLLSCPLLAQSLPQDDLEILDDNEEVITLEEFQVSAKSERGSYFGTETTAGTRIGGQIHEMPYNIQSFTEDFIEDFNLYEDDALMGFISGATSGTGEKTIRGFEHTVVYDGFAFGLTPSRANSAGTEVIKGPTSVFYGRTTPGGIINKKSKRPKLKPEHKLISSVGTDDTLYAALTGTGPIIKDKFYYFAFYEYSRIDGGTPSYELDHYKKETQAIGLSLLYKFGRQTSLTLTGQYQPEKNNDIPTSIVAVKYTDNSPAQLRWDGLGRFSISGPYSDREYKFWGFNALFEHRINQIWVFRNTVQGFSRDTDKEGWKGASTFHMSEHTFKSSSYDAVKGYDEHGNYFSNGQYTSSRVFSERSPYMQLQLIRQYGIQTDFVGTFRRPGVAHRLTFAIDATYRDLDDDDRKMSDQMLARLPLAVRYLNYDSPQYIPIQREQLGNRTTYYEQKTFTLGGLASYSVSMLNNRLMALASVRYDSYKDEVNDKMMPRMNSEKSDDKLTYSLGARYNIKGEDLIAYGSISTGYLPQNKVDKGYMELTDPYESKGAEIGFKGVNDDKTFRYTTSFYYIEQKNVRRENNSFNENVHSRQKTERQFLNNGVEEGIGVETELYYKPTRPLMFKLTLGWIDTQIKSNTEEPWTEGKRKAKSSKWTGSLLTEYRFLNGPLKGAHIGLTGTFRSRYIGNLEERTTAGAVRYPELWMPSLFLMRASTGYTFKVGKTQHKIVLSTSNLLGRTYYYQSGRPMRGREYVLTYNLTF